MKRRILILLILVIASVRFTSAQDSPYYEIMLNLGDIENRVFRNTLYLKYAPKNLQGAFFVNFYYELYLRSQEVTLCSFCPYPASLNVGYEQNFRLTDKFDFVFAGELGGRYVRYYYRDKPSEYSYNLGWHAGVAYRINDHAKAYFLFQRRYYFRLDLHKREFYAQPTIGLSWIIPRKK